MNSKMLSSDVRRSHNIAKGDVERGGLEMAEQDHASGVTEEALRSIAPLPVLGSAEFQGALSSAEFHTSPGAYAEDYTGARSRMPPALKTSVGSGLNDLPKLVGDTDTPLDLTANSSSMNDHTMTGGLAVANPVDVNSPLSHAREVTSSANKEGTKRRKQAVALIGCGVAIVVVVVVLLVALRFIPRDSNGPELEEPEEPTALGPTGTTSMAPEDELEPAMMMDDPFVAPLLPEATVRAIANEPESPQGLAYQWMLQDPALANYSEVRLRQRYGLATFYFSTTRNGTTEWREHTNWLSHEHHECEWYFSTWYYTSLDLFVKNIRTQVLVDFYEAWDGRVCDEDDHYQHLQIYNNDFQGSLPPELFSLLPSLESIVILQDAITGPIPTQIGGLSNLEIFAGIRNDFSGTLPTQLGLLTSLQVFGAGHNLEGPLPTELGLLGEKLEEMFLFSNRLDGTIPTQLGGLTRLRLLELDNNGLTGAIPSELGLLQQSTELSLFGNQFSGTIPSQLGSPLHLESLYVAGSPLLTGNIPSPLCSAIHFDCWNHKTDRSGLCGCGCSCI